MALGMKRGFLRHGASNAKSSERARSQNAPAVHVLTETDNSSIKKYRFCEWCQIQSENPHIVKADSRLSNSAYFLFLPFKDAKMVFVDSLESVQTISKWPLWDEPCSPVHTPSFEIRDSGKGLGMFAQRQIERGELIMRERPVYVTHPAVQIDPDQKHRFYEAALAGLSRTTQTSILSLHNAHPESDDVSPIRGRILTNALPATLPNTTTRFPALFSHLCRANHACTPNAQFSFCADIFVGRLCALRTIGAGEEVTIGYTELAAPREARQADLKARYGFACTCATCMLPESQAALSDVKRGGITRYFADMKGERFPPGASLGRVKQLITWAEEEGLIEAASALGISALRLAQRDQNHWEVLKFTVDTMNYVRALEGNDSAGFVALAARLGLTAHRLAAIFDSGNPIDYELFQRLLAKGSKE